MTHSPTTAVPAALTDIAARVNRRIAGCLDADARRWADLDAELAAPLASLRALVLAGGKRLRPAFCYWAFVGLGGDPDDPVVVDAGAALELLHTFALIHDDVMDGSALRHGVEAVHVEHRRRHARAGWRGEPDRFGDGVAILVGDLAFVYSDRFLAGAPPAARHVFDELRLEVNIGQYLDLLGTAQRSANPELARRICQYKSGKYTIERPLHLGAALASPYELPAVTDALSAYGMPLGEAFQLKDDLLGVFGDTAVTGKPVGEDLREGKPTLLYALARAAASGADLRLLDGRFGAADLDEAEVADLQAVFEASGARAKVADIIDGLVDEALDAAGRLPLAAAACEALTDLARFVSGRDH
jgi:geranylgeranyl diphosphate synthase type I